MISKRGWSPLRSINDARSYTQITVINYIVMNTNYRTEHERLRFPTISVALSEKPPLILPTQPF